VSVEQCRDVLTVEMVTINNFRPNELYTGDKKV